MPESQTAAIHPRKIMRKARSKKNLKPLREDLERRYFSGCWLLLGLL